MKPTLCVVALLFFNSVSAMEPEKNPRFVDLVKVGDKIGLTYDSESAVYHIRVYAAEVFEIVSASKRLAENELEEKYPSVVEAKRAAIELEKKAWQDRGNPPPEGKKPSFEAKLSSINKEELATVEQIGEDYVLLASQRMPNYRYAISMRWVTSIGWVNEVPVIVYTRLVATESVEASVSPTDQ